MKISVSRAVPSVETDDTMSLADSSSVVHCGHGDPAVQVARTPLTGTFILLVKESENKIQEGTY